MNGRNNSIIKKLKKDIENNKDDKIVPKLETVEVALVHCN